MYIPINNTVRSDRQYDKGVLKDVSTNDRQGNVLTYTHIQAIMRGFGSVVSI